MRSHSPAPAACPPTDRRVPVRQRPTLASLWPRPRGRPRSRSHLPLRERLQRALPAAPPLPLRLPRPEPPRSGWQRPASALNCGRAGPCRSIGRDFCGGKGILRRPRVVGQFLCEVVRGRLPAELLLQAVHPDVRFELGRSKQFACLLALACVTKIAQNRLELLRPPQRAAAAVPRAARAP